MDGALRWTDGQREGSVRTWRCYASAKAHIFLNIEKNDPCLLISIQQNCFMNGILKREASMIFRFSFIFLFQALLAMKGSFDVVWNLSLIFLLDGYV